MILFKMKVKFLLLFIMFFIPVLVFSQDMGNDIRLAHEYYRNKDFDKAEVLFKKIFDQTEARVYFVYYANCLIEQSKFDIAEKEIKRQIRKHKNDPSYLVHLGWCYRKQDLHEEAQEQYDKALLKLTDNASVIRSLAYAFMQRQEYEYAEKVYLTGRSISFEDFRSELANLYAVQRKYEKMINEYLDWLNESGKNLNAVQNRMQFFLNKDINDEFGEMLRVELLKRIQKSNSSIAFNKMLVWYFMQRKEFSKALFQEIAIDKRVNGTGRRIVDLAETAKSNDDFKTAIEAYDYVISKGRYTSLYINSKVGKLNVYFIQVEKGIIRDPLKIESLEKEFLETLEDIGIGFNTIQIILDLAYLQTFYLDKPEEAEELLTYTMKLQGLDIRLATQCKIRLGDVLVYQNDLNYAALIYGQAEKDNKGTSLGDMAKLKKAKLAYFANNFKWAQSQFDALKISTSKPVSNDAIFYSLLIEDNTHGDSLQSAMKAYAQAELMVFRNKKDSALVILDSLITNFPGHQLTDESYFLKAKIYEDSKQYDLAVTFYKKIITEHSWDILADIALFRLAVLFEDILDNKDEAAEYYKKLMLEHPDSIYVTEARRRFRKIREGIG